MTNPRSSTITLETAGVASEKSTGLHDTARLLTTITSDLVGMIYRCRIDADWSMELVSDGCLKLTGYRPDELVLNKHVSYEQITHPEDRERVRTTIYATLSSHSNHEVEYRILRADGLVRWVSERGVGIFGQTGQLVGLEGFIQDISDRIASNKALHEAVRGYRSIFENATEGIFQTTPNGRYINANPALARIYGHPNPETLIMVLQDIQHQLYVDPTRRAEFVRQMHECGNVRNFESQVYKRDGASSGYPRMPAP